MVAHNEPQKLKQTTKSSESGLITWISGFETGMKGRGVRWWGRRWWLWWGDMRRMRWTRRTVNRMRLTEWSSSWFHG